MSKHVARCVHMLLRCDISAVHFFLLIHKVIFFPCLPPWDLERMSIFTPTYHVALTITNRSCHKVAEEK